jgi:hypothetical protein
MKMKSAKKMFCALGLAGLTTLPAWAVPVETAGFLKYECWFPPLRDTNLTGTAVVVLLSDPNYPNTPDMTSYCGGLDSRTVFPDDTHEQYGVKASGWISPTVTGDYNFYIRSDDNSQLYVSTDSTEANLQMVAEELNCCNPFMEPGSGTQTTAAPLHLVAGQKYAIQVLFKEGTGGDFFQVAWQEAGSTNPASSLVPLTSCALSSMADPAGASVSITQQPADVSTPENSSVTFSVAATVVTPFGQYTGGGTPALGAAAPLGTKAQIATFYAWFTNGVEVPGANGTNFTIAWPKTASDNGKKIKCYVAVPGLPTYTTEATLTVTADTTPPTIAKAVPDMTFTAITVKFSEPVTDSALTAANYTLDQGASVSSVARVDDLTVKLTTSKLGEGQTYLLSVKNVQDTATPANTIAANAQVQVKTYVFLAGTILHQKYNSVSDNNGWPVGNLTNDVRFPNSPDREDLMTTWEYPAAGAGRVAADPARNYFDCIQGYFIPPVTTNYVFYTAGADRFALFLSTDENPANKHMITQLSGWTNPRRWTEGQPVTAGVPTTIPGAQSDQFGATEWPGGNTISLTAGKRYYMMLIHHDPSWCGADDSAATYTYENEPAPTPGDAPKLTANLVGYYYDPNGASITFSQQPQNATAMEGNTATFTAAVSGTSAYGTNLVLQWQAAPQGSTTYTNISGATGMKYETLPLTIASDGLQFRLQVTIPPITEYSSVASLTVTKNTALPVLSAGAMAVDSSGNVEISIGFDKPMDESSLRTVANFTPSSGTISTLTVCSNRFTANSLNPLVAIRKQTVVLKVTGFTATSGTLTVKNVKDAFGNQITSTTLPFTVDTTMKWGVVGAPPAAGWNAVAEIAPGAFDVYSDGVSEWGNYDETTFVYEQVTGDFDKKVRVEYQDGSSQWARAGLIVRDVTNFGVDAATQQGSQPGNSPSSPYDGKAGRYQKIHVNPVGATLTGPGTPGNAAWEGNRRLDTGGGCTSALNGVNSTPLYPNAWCRIQRVGQKFTVYRSDDGVNWINMGSTTWGVDDVTKTPMPDAVYVGPEFSPEIGNVSQAADQGTFLAQFRDYGNYVAAFNAQLKISTDASGKVTLTWTAGTLVSSPTVQGSYIPVQNATSPYVATPAGAATTFYRVKQ